MATITTTPDITELTRSASRSTLISISIIVPTLNEEKVIGKCLDALTRLKYLHDLEIIVVDNGSRDSTRDIVRSYENRLNLTLIQKEGVHISALRNAGAAIAIGNIFAFLDADCIPKPDWLTRVPELLSTENAGVVGAYYSIPNDSSWVAQAWYGDEHLKKRGAVSFVPAGTLLISRSNFLRIGGFDATIQTNEDYEFCQRVRAAGLRVVAMPELSVIHLGTPQTLRTFYQKQKWHGQNVFTVFLRDIRRLPNAKAVFFALFMLTAMAAIAGGVVVEILADSSIALAAAVFVLVMAPGVLAVRATLERRRPGLFPPLFVLFLIYGVARATCLLHSDCRRAKDREGYR
jgi:GT2 family glycosyltransferase